MDAVIAFLISYGCWGLLVSAFVAGSIIPFPSEAVFVGLQAIGLQPWELLVFATVGNTLGGMFNYGLGRLGKMEWIERWLHIKPEKVERAQRFVEKRGAPMALLAVLPLFGGPVTVALGLMRANPWACCLYMTIGKFGRYLILMYGANMIL